MGLFDWFSTTARKSEAAAHIQLYFEVSQRLGAFNGPPAEAANRITELACNRAPELARKWKGFVLAAGVLAIAIMEDDLPMEARDHCAMALAGMLKAADQQKHMHSYEEQDMLRLTKSVYTEFRRMVPSPEYQPVKPKVQEPIKIATVAKADTVQDRQRSMDELIKRMKA